VDLAVEAVGMESVFLDALSAARKQGKVLMIGNPGSDYGLPKALASSILRHKLTILGTWNSHFAQQDGSDWVDVLRAFSLGKVGAAPLISHRVPLEGGVEALEMMRDGKEFFQKVLMIPGRDS